MTRSFLLKIVEWLRGWARSYETIYCQLGLRTCSHCRKKGRKKARKMERA